MSQNQYVFMKQPKIERLYRVDSPPGLQVDWIKATSPADAIKKSKKRISKLKNTKSKIIAYIVEDVDDSSQFDYRGYTERTSGFFRF